MTPPFTSRPACSKSPLRSRTLARALLFVGLLVGLVSFTFYATRIVASQREQLTAQLTRRAKMERLIAELRQQRDEITSELERAKHDLAQLPSASAPSARAIVRKPEIQAWLARAKHLQQLFTAKPEWQIPEMHWLTDAHWLHAAQKAQFGTESETRMALATVRDLAKAEFTTALAQAWTAFTKAHPGRSPTTPLALAPYFEKLPAPAALARYEIVENHHPIREKVPIDEDYDTRYYIAKNGEKTPVKAPAAWILEDYPTTIQRAFAAYRKANKNTFPDVYRDLLPYFDPPLNPVQREKLLQAERQPQH